jgi:hypothetical protein
MREPPSDFNRGRPSLFYPVSNLARFRYHTGAEPRPLEPDEPCPVLFRDLGPAATALFLRGRLRRLAGPLSPIIYMRTCEYVEPYTDHEQIGRLVFLRPLVLQPWHSGVPTVYVAPAEQLLPASAVGFVPGDVPLAKAAELAGDLKDVTEWREVLGGRCHDDALAETLYRLDLLDAELRETEERAAPLRAWLQSSSKDRRQRAREQMARAGLTEEDLCSAWHHLSRPRRAEVREALRRLPCLPEE